MKNMICIVCPNGCSLSIEKCDNEWKVERNLCKKGREFAISEMTDPKRTLCSTVKTIYRELPRLPVRSRGEISRDFIMPVMKEINKVRLQTIVHRGDVIIENVSDIGVDIIATSDMYLYTGGEKI